MANENPSDARTACRRVPLWETAEADLATCQLLALSGPQVVRHRWPRAVLGSFSVIGEGMGWMARITSAILPANVGDYCVGMLSFDLEGSNERVFGIHENTV